MDEVETGGNKSAPSLYREARDMLEHCAMTYTIAEYRDWTKTQVSSLPWSGDELIALMTETRDQFVEKYIGDGEERVELISEILHRWKAEQAQLVQFIDEHAETELVYAIWVESSQQRIVLGFRGSVTKTDWKIDATAVQMSVDVKDRGLPPRVEHADVHAGFYQYLFHKNGNGKKSKYETIMDQLNDLFAIHKEYQLYVTGHSLGGALCTMFSAFCSTDNTPERRDDNVPQHVNCISFAAPKIGTQKMRRMIHQAEMNGRLRFLRVVNYKDPVPNLPKDVFLAFQSDLACNCFMNCFCQRNMFRHAGMELKCYPDNRCTIGHLPHDRWTFACLPQFVADVLKTIVRWFSFLVALIKFVTCHGENYRRYHAWLVYFHWLDQNKETLEQLDLDSLYQKVNDNDYSDVVKRRF